jgi:hypothetical protein
MAKKAKRKQKENNIKEKELIDNIANSNNEKDYYPILDKENNNFFLKLMLVFLVILLCLTLFYKFVILNPKAIFASGLNSSYNYLNNILNYLNKNDYLNTPTKIDGVLKMSTTDSNYKDLDNYSFDIGAGIDTENKLCDANIKFDNNNNELMNLNYYNKNNTEYLELQNIYNNIIKLRNSNVIIDNVMNNVKKINYSLLSKTIKSIKGIINENIEANMIKIDYKNNYVSLSLTKEEYSKLLSNTLTDINTNNNLKQNLANSLSVDNETIDNVLNELLKISLTSNFDTIEFIYDYDGILANINTLEIKTDNKTIIKVSSSSIYLNIDYNNYNIVLNNNENLIIKKDDKNIINFTFNELKLNIIDADYEKEDNTKGNIHFTLKDDGHGNMSLSAIKNDNAYSLNYDFDILTKQIINDVDETKVIDINDVSEDDYLNIYNKLKNNTKNTLLGDYITNMVETLLKY